MQTVCNSSAMRLRSVWISDLHLGFRGCRADFLLDFLRSVHADRVYLLGDIIDVWSMERRLYWPKSHNAVVQTLFAMARQGTKVVFVPGNHDEAFRAYEGLAFGNMRIESRAIHTTADGKRLLLLHGDEFDRVVECSPLLAKFGSRAYEILLRLNGVVGYVRRKLGLPYWSIASAAKLCIKRACSYISDFEQAVVKAAREARVDGVICGHIHHAAITEIEDMLYMNCGDWVESCTALVEHSNGQIELLRWADARQRAGRRADSEVALPQAA